MSELKAGGLAMIIGASKVPENIGKIVVLDRIIQPDEVYRHGVGKFKNGSGEAVWLVRGGVVSSLGVPGIAQAAPRNLMPINDPGEDVIDANEVPRKDEVSA